MPNQRTAPNMGFETRLCLDPGQSASHASQYEAQQTDRSSVFVSKRRSQISACPAATEPPVRAASWPFTPACRHGEAKMLVSLDKAGLALRRDGSTFFDDS
jgi:hypothetical protein